MTFVTVIVRWNQTPKKTNFGLHAKRWYIGHWNQRNLYLTHASIQVSQDSNGDEVDHFLNTAKGVLADSVMERESFDVLLRDHTLWLPMSKYSITYTDMSHRSSFVQHILDIHNLLENNGWTTCDPPRNSDSVTAVKLSCEHVSYLRDTVQVNIPCSASQ